MEASATGNGMEKAKDSLYTRAAAALVMVGIQLGVWIANRAGYDRTIALGNKAGDLLYGLLRRPRRRIQHNLRLAFGDGLPEAECTRIARGVLRYFAKNWLDLFFYGGSNKQVFMDRITIQGLEHLDSALAKGRGVIAVSGHIGNYPLLGTQFTERGYDFTVVIRDPKSSISSRVYEKCRAMIRLQTTYTTPERQFFKNAMKTFARNGILCLISDENKRTGGVFVDFFGRPASTPPGPAALALRTGAAIVPIFILRNPDNSQRIIIDEEISWQKTGDSASDMVAITARFTAVIEQYIRRDLAQWMWTNFRWRTQPDGPSDVAKLKKSQPIKKLKKKLLKLLSGF
jgi:Kdo2-lipid IVA lauroyltransferase/acyltransferase